MTTFSNEILDNVIKHILIILQKNWAIDIDQNDFDNDHIIFYPDTVLETKSMFYLYHTFEFSKRCIEIVD